MFWQMIGVCTFGADEYVVQNSEGTGSALKSTVDSLLKFSGHVAEAIKPRFEPLRAGCGTPADAKTTLTGCFAGEFKLPIGVTEVNFGKTNAARDR